MNDDPVDAIMAVMREAFPPTYGEAWTRQQVTEALMFPSTDYILHDQPSEEQIHAEQTKGFILSRYAADEVELLLIAVRPEFRGQGIGRTIMDRFLETSRARGACKVFLEMRAGNPAEHLYRACGFRQIGLRKGYYRGAVGGPIDAITFGRSI